MDECALGTHDCQRNSHCVDEEDGYSCVCNSGYRRDDRNICIGMYVVHSLPLTPSMAVT